MWVAFTGAGYATHGYVDVNAAGLAVRFVLTVGGADFGGEFGEGRHAFPLPPGALGVSVAPDGEVAYANLDGAGLVVPA